MLCYAGLLQGSLAILCYAFAVLCAMLMQELGRCAMLRVATCCARLCQRLRLLVQRYATLFYAMICKGKG